MQNKRQWQICREDFRLLIAQKSMPPKMEIKLRYLEAAISGNTITQELFNELPQFERMSLKEMPFDTMISLFSSIVRCLCGKEIVTLFTAQKAWIKKQEYFSSWDVYELTCDTNVLAIFKIKEKRTLWREFKVEKLGVSKSHRQQKKKYIFGVVYDRRKYSIGFDEQKTCSRIHARLTNLVVQIRAQKTTAVDPSSIKNSERLKTVSDDLQFEKQQIIFESEFNEERYFEQQQKQFLSNLQNKIDQLQFGNDSDYQLLKNINKGKIMQNQRINTLKVCMVIQNCSIQNIVEAYVRFNAWNLQVDSFKVINRIRNNTFLAYLKMKKYGVFSYQRQAYITISYFKACPCLVVKEQPPNNKQTSKLLQNSKHYLIINTVQGESNNGQNKGAVRMDFSQVIQFSTVQDNDAMVFMIVLSKIDYKGYEYLSNNSEINLNFMSDICSLSKYCQQTSLSGTNLKMFIFNYCVCKNKGRKNSAVSEIQLNSQIENSSAILSSSQKKPQPEASHDLSKNQIVRAIEDTHNVIRNDHIIQFIKNKKYESYYFKHYFGEQTHSEKFVQSKYTLGQVKDYLLQAGRWKLVNNDLIFCDEEALRIQKGIIKMVLKQIASNITKGKSIMNMSLPVQMFDKKSMLEIVANLMGFFPVFIHEAINANNLVEQIKYVTMAFMFISSCSPNIEKPFNPILGETLQGWLGGIPIYFEQTFHHPPTSTYYMKTKQFESYGSFDTHVDMGINSVTSKVSCLFTVKIYKTKTEYVIKLPFFEMGGLMFGDRILRLSGRSFVYEKKNDLYCQFSAGKDKKNVYEYNYKIKANDIAGGIFKVTNHFGKKILNLDRSKSFEGIKPDDIIEKYCQISGKWYGDMYFDDVAYKTVEKGPFPVRIQRPVYLLPSDSLFRQDIVYKGWGLLDKSNEEKQVLENIQRKDKRLRQEAKSSKK